MEPAPILSPRRRLAVLAGLWLFLAGVVLLFRAVVFPFALAALLAYLMAPVVERLGRLRVGGRALPRWVAVLLLYAAFLLGLWGFLVAVAPQIYRELVRISAEGAAWLGSLTPARVQELAQHAEAWLNAHGVPVALSSRALEGEGDMGSPFSIAMDLQETINVGVARLSALLKDDFGNIVALSRELLTALLTTVFGLLFVLMIAAFFSIDLAAIRGYARSLVPPELHGDARVLLERVDRGLAGVVRGQVTICLINGLLTFVGLLIFGVKFAFVLASLATVCSLVPIFGTFISSVPIVVFAATQSLRAGLAMVIWILGIHALEAYFLNPKIMGTAARIHPVVVAFALVAMERAFGLGGALFAAPVAAIVVACFEFARHKAQAPVTPRPD